MGIIYCAQNKVNGKRYIGQTCRSLGERRRDHERWVRKPSSAPSPSVFVSALRKYGVDSFKWSIVFDGIPNEDLNEYEIDAIAVYKTLSPNGYNLMTGGGANGLHSEDTKKKLSEASKNISDETRRKISEALKRRGPCSEETRKKMSEGVKRAHRHRKPPSESTRKKISESSRGRKKPPVSEETRQKMSEAGKRRAPPSDEARQKMSEAGRNRWADKREAKNLARARRAEAEQGKIECESRSTINR